MTTLMLWCLCVEGVSLADAHWCVYVGFEHHLAYQHRCLASHVRLCVPLCPVVCLYPHQLPWLCRLLECRACHSAHRYLAIPPSLCTSALSLFTSLTHAELHVLPCAHSPKCPIHVYIAPVLPASSISHQFSSSQ